MNSWRNRRFMMQDAIRIFGFLLALPLSLLFPDFFLMD